MERLLQLLTDASDRWWGMLIALAIPIFISFSPVLVGGGIFSEQPFWDSLPHYVFYQNAIRNGESFLWNPMNFSGFPSFAGTVGFFSPVHYLVFNFFPAIPAFHWLIFLDFALAASFTSLLLKDFRVPLFGQYIGGLAYVLSQIVYIASLPMANTVLFLPLLFFTLSRLRRPKPFGYLLLAIAVIGWGWIAGVTQYVLYALIAGLTFTVYVGWRDRRVLAWGAGAFILGTALGLIQLAPQTLFAGFSTRSGGLSYAVASEDPVLPTDAIRFFLPFFEPPLGIPFGSTGAEPFLYLGIIPLFFLLAALRDRSAAGRFFLFLFLGALALSVIYSPFFWVLSKLPVFDYFRVPSRWMMVGLFSASVLAGLGYERMASAHPGRWARFLARAFFTVLIAAVAAVGGLSVAFRFFSIETERFLERIAGALLGKSPELLSPFHHELIGRVLAKVRELTALERPEVFLPLVMFAVGTLALWTFLHRARREELVPWLAVLTALNFVAIVPLSYATLSRKLVTEPPPIAEFLGERISSGNELVAGRVYEFLTDQYFAEQAQAIASDRALAESEFQAAVLIPNTNLYFGISSAGYFDQLRSKAMSDLLAFLGDPFSGVSGDPAYGSDLRRLSSREEQVQLFAARKPLLDFLGIRYVISGFMLDERVLPKVFETATAQGIPLRLYENREAKPLVYFAEEVQPVSGGEEAVFRTFKENNFSGVFVSCDQECPESSRRYAQGVVELIEQKNGRLVLKAVSSQPSFLVISQNHLPGWRATIDGRDVPIQTVNTVYMGIGVPPGEHRVELSYSYPCPSRKIFECLGVTF